MYTAVFGTTFVQKLLSKLGLATLRI